jgi:hypothetical protein
MNKSAQMIELRMSRISLAERTKESRSPKH